MSSFGPMTLFSMSELPYHHELPTEKSSITESFRIMLTTRLLGMMDQREIHQSYTAFKFLRVAAVAGKAAAICGLT